MSRRARVLAPLLALVCASSGALASKKAFNIYDDLLAYPQFQVFFPDEYILESQARELLQTPHGGAPIRDEQFDESKHAQVSLGTRQEAGNEEATDAGFLTYKEMLLDGQRYLCQIPQVEGDDRSQTNETDNLNEDDEQKELARATDRGLELLREMEGKCMYYISGWWSYSFCYKKQIKQFHARPFGPGVPNYPPLEDPATHSFVLGRFPSSSGNGGGAEDVEGVAEHKKASTTDIAELQTKGGSRYLVQRLGGGTRCDLTGKPRKIEVQFHCHPQSTDRIGWIKELTTCSYLMVIYTPRLCNDVAFLPPQQDKPHAIDCREILAAEEVPEWESERAYHLAQQLVEAAATPAFPVVGDIEVGAQKLVGGEGKQIQKGRVASVGEDKVEVVAKRENGEIQRLSNEELKKFGLDSEKLERLKNQIEAEANGKDWALEIVESNGERGIRGIIDSDEDEVDGADQNAQDAGSGQHEQEAAAEPVVKSTQSTGKDARPASEEQGTVTEEVEDGSEEVFYKDEL
ncbi:PRKCSH domain-containing protein [Aspergillus clavatus NRRL 1]|uniref:Endoplasmic reticulum lectin n=1 Tax=Aspergillus clavatus (strain ATCC 1007 / CBS 513.65 / DSM 816 / NCTC 3887 / NRRL 1 / QM 1276 / 107) TaxID=344612 RepID=A1C3Z3_ASPCL|nr:misfolded glycoproteins degradation protein Yos9, putative [Aspergillus clavatus NRRL 1]EAW15133.1 misfolded glycoproteins degradation protein Yos9, putative [Aspergillus clavatus NRRL 1]